MIKWVVIVAFVIFYPMLISMYVYLPLFIGLMGYVMIEGIEKKQWRYIFIALLYFINLEANLSLPFFLTLISTLTVYLFFYQRMRIVKHCKICIRIITVVLIDLLYLGILLGYDYLFQTESIVMDKILLYSLIADMFVVAVIP